MTEKLICRIRGEGDHLVCQSQEDAEKLEGVFIDWLHRGYFEVKAIRGTHIVWGLTNWGKEHIGDIIKVEGKQ